MFGMRKESRSAVAAISFWERLIPCKQRLYNYIQKSLNFSVEADDVFQETVLHAFQYFRSFEEGKEFRAWLFAIAHNEVKKHYKKASKISSSLAPERLGSADTSHLRHLVGEVYRFAEKMKPRQREVFFLFYDGGFTISDISRITGLREGNIKFLLNQARRNLKTILGEQNV